MGANARNPAYVLCVAELAESSDSLTRHEDGISTPGEENRYTASTLGTIA